MDSEIETHTTPMARSTRARLAGRRCRRSASSRRCSASSAPWARSASRRRSRRHDRLGVGRHFLGILLAYAVVEPLGGLIEQKVDEGSKELQCIKTTLLASMQGYAPQVAVEFGRKVLYSKDRPTFSELEGHVKGKKA
jgi:hypothetical protein